MGIDKISSSPRKAEDFSPKNIDNLLNKMDTKVGKTKETKELSSYTIDQLLANNGAQFVDIIKNRQNYPANEPLDAIKIVNAAMVNSTQRDIILNSLEKRASLKAFIQALGEEYLSSNNRLTQGEIDASRDFTSRVSFGLSNDIKNDVFAEPVSSILKNCCLKNLDTQTDMNGFFSVSTVYWFEKAAFNGSIQASTINTFMNTLYSHGENPNTTILIEVLTFPSVFSGEAVSGTLEEPNCYRILEIQIDKNRYGRISGSFKKAVIDLGDKLIPYVQSKDRAGMISLWEKLQFAGLQGDKKLSVFKIYIDKALSFDDDPNYFSDILTYIYSFYPYYPVTDENFEFTKENFLNAIRNKSIAYIEQAKTLNNLNPRGLSSALSFVTLLAPKYNYDLDLSFLGISKELFNKRKDNPICSPTRIYGDPGFVDTGDPFASSAEHLASMHYKTNFIGNYFENIINLVNAHGKESIQKLNDVYNLDFFDRYNFTFLDHMYRNIDKPTGKPMMWIFANKRDHNGAFNSYPDETDLLGDYDVRIFEPGDDNNKFFKETLKKFSDDLGGLQGKVPFMRIGMHGSTNNMLKKGGENIDYGASDRIWATDPAFWEGIQPYVYGGKLFIDACSTAGHTGTGELGAIAEMAATYSGVKETYAPANDAPTGSFVTIDGQVLYKFMGTTVQYNAGNNLPIPNLEEVKIQLQEKYNLSQGTEKVESIAIKDSKDRLFVDDDGKKYGIGLINATTRTYGVYWEGSSSNFIEFSLDGNEILISKNLVEKGKTLTLPYYLVGADSDINKLMYTYDNGTIDGVTYDLINHTYKPHVLSFLTVEGSYTQPTIEQQNTGYRLFPNPTIDGKFTFEFFDDKLINGDISIWTMSGKFIKTIKADTQNMNIDIEDLQAGVYFIRLGKIAAKIVKE